METRAKKSRLISSCLMTIASPNNIKVTILLKRQKYQYSLLDARPLKVAYFLKHVFTAHKNPFSSFAAMGEIKELDIGFSLVKLGERGCPPSSVIFLLGGSLSNIPSLGVGLITRVSS